MQNRPEIVAELSGNHDGNLERALQLMDLAVANGADAVKIQTYTEDSLTIDSDRPEFQINGGLWDGQTLYSLYKKAKTPREWMKPMFEHARNRGIKLFSSPFSASDVEALEAAGCPRYKIASFELNDVDLIALCASTKKPMVMSTGLALLQEVDRAVEIARKNGCQDLTLLHCESRYPADPKLFNLKTISFFKKRYGCKAGLSNHALGDTLDIAATVLGADMIEKHFTDDRSKGSVDSAFSMEPSDLSQLRQDTETAVTALGIEDIVLKEDEYDMRNGRRSVYLVKSLKRGEVLSREHVKVIRPGLGMEPYLLKSQLGRKAARDLDAPLPLRTDDLED